MRNFDYLKQIPALSDLYNFCHAAEEMQLSDYDSCGWNCRKALEWTVRAVYKLKHQPVGERDNLYTLSTGKPFTELIADDDKLMMAVHYIRKVGNVAVHQGGITQREAYFCLLNTYNVVGGVLLSLGVLETLAPFSKDLIPAKPQPHVATSDTVPEAPKTFVDAVPEENVKKPVKAEMPEDISEAETRKEFIDLMLREAGWKVVEVEKIKEVITPEEKALIEDFNLKVKQLTQLQHTGLMTQDTVKLAPVLMDSSYNHPPDTILRYTDEWCRFEYRPVTQSLTYSIRDSLTTLVARQYKHRFLWWRWGTKGYDVKIVNHNPHSTIKYNTFIVQSKQE